MNIYVGNLSFEATEADVEQAFGEFGDVKSVHIVQDRDTGRSRGFGFVEMHDVVQKQWYRYNNPRTVKISCPFQGYH